MLMKQVKNLVPKIIVLIIIFVLLATAAGCASSSSVDSPGTSAQDEASQSSENPEPVATDQDPEQEGSTVSDEPSESPEKVDPGEEDEPAEDDESSTLSEEQFNMARELGLIVLEESVKAPVFTLPTLDGSEITLSDLRGRFVVLNFWTTKCPPCVAEMDYFEAAARTYPDELTILTVDIRESESKVRDFFGDDEKTFTVVLDKTGEVTSAYGIRYTPTTLFIDTEGNVPYAKIGAFASQEQFEDCVALLLELA